MLKVLGRNTSANVQKVLWAIAELGLPCERIDIGGPFGGNRDATYLALNPNGLVPTLDDDGFVLWESNAILRYLGTKYGADVLEPAAAQARALAGQWMDWQLSVAGPALMPLFMGLIRTPPEKRDPQAIAAGRTKSLEAMAVLNSQLVKTAYLAGESFSYGDIPAAVIVHRVAALVPDRPPMTGVDRWYGEIANRPAFRAQVADIPLV